jgi:Na+/H+-translocating membrane pyrophosphatase
MDYPIKSKDSIIDYLLQLNNKLTDSDLNKLNYIIIFGPFVLTLLCSLFISTKIVLVFLFVLFFSLAMMLYSLKVLLRIVTKDTGNERMIEISNAIREGAEGFFMIQYNTIFKLSIVFGIIIFIFYIGRNISGGDDRITNTLGKTLTTIFVVCSFFLGAFCSAFAGYSGMWVSVRANIRVAAAATRCYNDALVTCFDGGLFASIINISLALLGISINYLTIYFALYLKSKSGTEVPYENIPLLLVGFSFGASFVAMFAQLGGGIYTKAADVGADLIGKIEMGMAEDDARNPAVIADLVGDNVGDCAGQAADLFESISAEILSAMILGSTLAEKINLSSENSFSTSDNNYMSNNIDIKSGFITFPLIIHCLDLVVSIIGSMYIKTKPGLPMGGTEYQDIEDPLDVMKRGYRISVGLGNYF